MQKTFLLTLLLCTSFLAHANTDIEVDQLVEKCKCLKGNYKGKNLIDTENKLEQLDQLVEKCQCLAKKCKCKDESITAVDTDKLVEKCKCLEEKCKCHKIDVAEVALCTTIIHKNVE